MLSVLADQDNAIRLASAGVALKFAGSLGGVASGANAIRTSAPAVDVPSVVIETLVSGSMNVLPTGKAASLKLDVAGVMSRSCVWIRFAEQVQNDIGEGIGAGVSGTPAIYINGVLVEGGAVAFDAIARALDSELDRAKR